MTIADDERLNDLMAENAALRDRLSCCMRAEGTRSDAGRLAAAEAEIATLRQALHRSETRYRLIVESAVDYAIIATDLDGVITTWNGAAEKVTGWNAGQIVGRPIATIFTPEDVEAGVPDREMRFSLTMGRAQDERWHRRADGSRFFASGEMTPLLDDEEAPTGYLKILRDRTSEKEERSKLEASRERLALALDAAALVGTWDWDIVGDALYADRRFAFLFGVDPALAEEGVPVANYLGGIHPDDLPLVGASIDRSLATGEVFDEEYRTIDREGQIHWVAARGRCFRDDDGRPVRFPGAILDRTAERAREARQAALLRLSDELAAVDEPGEHAAKALQILGETLGVTRTGYAEVEPDGLHVSILSEWRAEGVAPLETRYRISSFSERLVRELRSGLVVVEDVADFARSEGQRKAFDVIGVCAFVNMALIESGKVRVLLFLHADRRRSWPREEIAFIREILNRTWAFSQRRRAEQALRAAEARLRLAHEAAEIGTFDYDPSTGVLEWDERCREVFGVPPGAPVTYEGTFVAGLHPDDRERVKTVVEGVLDPASEGDYDIVYRTVGREDGLVRHVHAKGQTLVEDGRTVRFVGAVRDITEQKLAEERQLLLTRELQHRVKNTLAMVNALANQTLRRAPNVQDGLAAFSARLIALGRAHDILTQTSWTSAPIGAIVRNALESHLPADETRIFATGPDFRLTARQSLALALALHELATNAAKYGSLSNETGRVAIEWSIVRQEDGRRLGFVWRETGGPAVEPPASRGFGSRLIEQALASEFGGTVAMDYRPGGLVCTIEAAVVDEPHEA